MANTMNGRRGIKAVIKREANIIRIKIKKQTMRTTRSNTHKHKDVRTTSYATVVEAITLHLNAQNVKPDPGGMDSQ